MILVTFEPVWLVCAGSRELAETQSSITSANVFPSFQHFLGCHCKCEGLVITQKKTATHEEDAESIKASRLKTAEREICLGLQGG